MDAKQSALIEQLIRSTEDFRDEVRADMLEIRKDMSTVKRGLYGEHENDQPGALARIAATEAEVSILKEFKKRILWVWGAIVTFAVGGWELMGDHIKGFFK